MKKAILLLLLTVAFTSCKNKPERENKIIVAEWLLGKWENNSAQGNLSESWEKINDSTYNGHSYFIKEKDTLHFESIELKQKGTDLYYIPTVKGQNDDKAVEFKMTLSTPKQLVFENPQHDYPQKLVYNQITNDSLVATISGIQQGKKSTESFPMKRSK